MKYFSSNKLPIFLISLLCLILITIWFKDGKLLATGEEGLMLVNPQKAINLYKYSWVENGIGGGTPGSNTLISLLYLVSLFEKIGLPIWFFQALLFLLLMFIGSISVYFLTKELFRTIDKEIHRVDLGFIAAIFYILNPISLLGIWYRFLLGFMLFYALAPLFFYLFIIGLKNKKKTFIILLPLLSLFFTFAFAPPAAILLLWLLPFIYSLLESLTYSKTGKLSLNFYPLVYFTFISIFWVLINIWWIFPYVELSKLAFGSEIDSVQASNTLKANSQDFTLDNVVRLIHGGFLYRNEEFGSIYKTPIFLIFSWLIPIITIYGLIKLKKGRVKWFFISSFLLLLYLSKGTAPPLGGIFLWFFNLFPPLQVYRNPFEKIGMLLPIVYAPLFSFGLVYLLSNKISQIKYRKILFICAICLLALNTWPFFTGSIISFGKRDIRVVVPSSFREANKAMPAGNHIIFSIPVMGGGSGFYKWEYGYKGVEASMYLFNYPVINTFYDANSFYGQILIGISNGLLHNLVGLAQLFSADIIAYRKDTDVSAFGYNLDAMERSKKMIDEGNLTKIFDSPQVSLWSLPKEKIVPIIYTPHSVKMGDSPAELISLLEDNKFDPKLETYICVNKDKCKPFMAGYDISKIQIKSAPEKSEVQKMSPVSYKVRITGSKGKFILVFNNTYHPGWIAFVKSKPISNEKHIVANGYANGFIIDEIGNFDISLKFAPEEAGKKSLLVSLVFISFGMLILFTTIFNRY